MAKLTLTPLTNLSNPSSVTSLNSNFDAIEEAIENTLSRDGMLPNEMEADLDMNSNDILNAGSIYCERLFIDGVEHTNEGVEGGGGGGEVDLDALDLRYVNTVGPDEMEGPLTMRNGVHTVVISVAADGTINIQPGTGDQILAINSNTAASGATGQTITGRFRSCMPIVIRNTSGVLASGATGVASALVRTANASSVTHTIRKNDGTVGQDFQVGNYFSVTQEGAGQVILAPANVNVIFSLPSTHLPRTRTQHSVITATLKEVTGSTELWVISGDMATV